MNRTMLLSKIHGAVVTGADLEYEGSIGISPELIAAADLLPYERVEVYNITNGERLATYVIVGEPGEITLNGAAARKALIGDRIIIAAYTTCDEEAARTHEPAVVLVGKDNHDFRLKDQGG